MEKVAEKAGKAAPAMAIAGVLVTAPQVQHAAGLGNAGKSPVVATAMVKPGHAATAATLDAAAAHAAKATTHAERSAQRSYDVQSGDTLSGIAQRFYHNPDDWQWLYHENASTISDPNLIYVGEKLSVPSDPPAHFTLSNYQPRHAKATTTSATQSSGDGDSDSGSSGSTQSSGASSGGSSSSGSSSSGNGSSTLSGTLSCSGLEQLWEQAGGNPGSAFMAAEIAMAESGGQQYALSPANDRGYWQINWSNGSLSTFDAYGNARAAVILSNNGSNWSPWVTYQTGAYAGRC